MVPFGAVKIAVKLKLAPCFPPHLFGQGDTLGSLDTRVSPSRRDPSPPPHPYSLEGVNGLVSWWWAMYGGNVVTQVCPITVAMFITSALLVACDISDRLIWSPSMNYEPDSAAGRVAIGRSGARGELNVNVRLKHN